MKQITMCGLISQHLSAYIVHFVRSANEGKVGLLSRLLRTLDIFKHEHSAFCMIQIASLLLSSRGIETSVKYEYEIWVMGANSIVGSRTQHVPRDARQVNQRRCDGRRSGA